MALDIRKALDLAAQHHVSVPTHATLIEYRIQVWNGSAWEDLLNARSFDGVEGFSDAKKLRQIQVDAGYQSRLVAVVEVS